ncbi:N-acetylmuramic acid 6-phosphate etherase [Glaciecola sp. KUL10]|uniref:N-acetylmuramic acid 6-phosphate etherase n=1 Tax=Glaciecola sp. (strain KUL10) TaxID=2161813 RepID=UPI000D787880|nr:N-acetylmuramic acid 6-phosphate etherase [Glaciecola sp. KUL10]GBL03917.1 RpiR family transcriptional regulator [Glaciecola sp. KUL10]
MNEEQNAILAQLDAIVSESRNPNTMDIDLLELPQILEKINHEDSVVAHAVKQNINAISIAAQAALKALKNGGRVIYIGAGTSGRLGILDAVECRPTFSVPDGVFIGVIAGGNKAITDAVEGAEDNEKAGQEDLSKLKLNQNDFVLGIAASGRTPYVIGALTYANSLSCSTACLVCNPQTPLLKVADIGICINVGPECLTGSTRMKSGTAQKLVLNMISTSVMIKMGKAYENLMVDVNASNKKLIARAVRIVMQATQCDAELARHYLQLADNSAKLAILMILTGLEVDSARDLLAKNQGYLRLAQNSVSSINEQHARNKEDM